MQADQEGPALGTPEKSGNLRRSRSEYYISPGSYHRFARRSNIRGYDQVVKAFTETRTARSFTILEH